jgi:hypothetical protein
MLAAWAHGVGSCIGSLYPDDNARRARALPGRRPLEELVGWERYGRRRHA